MITIKVQHTVDKRGFLKTFKVLDVKCDNRLELYAGETTEVDVCISHDRYITCLSAILWINTKSYKTDEYVISGSLNNERYKSLLVKWNSRPDILRVIDTSMQNLGEL